MLTPGDVVRADLGTPIGSEAGMIRPAVVVTATRILRGQPNVVQIVPLTTTLRHSATEVLVEIDHGNGLIAPSAAQCQHVRSVSMRRIREHLGNVGPVTLGEIREVIALLIDV